MVNGRRVGLGANGEVGKKRSWISQTFHQWRASFYGRQLIE